MRFDWHHVVERCSVTATPSPAATRSPLVVAFAGSVGRSAAADPGRDARRTISSIQSIRRLAAAGGAGALLWLAANCVHEPRMIAPPPLPTVRSRRCSCDDVVWPRCRRQITILFRGCGGGHVTPPAHYATVMGGDSSADVAGADDDNDTSRQRRPEIAGRLTAERRHCAFAMMEIDPLSAISGRPPVCRSTLPPPARSLAHPFSVQISAFFSAKIIARRPPRNAGAAASGTYINDASAIMKCVDQRTRLG